MMSWKEYSINWLTGMLKMFTYHSFCTQTSKTLCTLALSSSRYSGLLLMLAWLLCRMSDMFNRKYTLCVEFSGPQVSHKIMSIIISWRSIVSKHRFCVCVWIPIRGMVLVFDKRSSWFGQQINFTACLWNRHMLNIVNTLVRKSCPTFPVIAGTRNIRHTFCTQKHVPDISSWPHKWSWKRQYRLEYSQSSCFWSEDIII